MKKDTNNSKKDLKLRDKEKLFQAITSLYNDKTLSLSEEFRECLFQAATLLDKNEDISLVASKLSPHIHSELLKNKNQKELLSLYDLVKNYRKNYLKVLDTVLTIF